MLVSSFFDPRFLAAQPTEIEYPCPADNAAFVDGDAVDERGCEGEDPLHAYVTRYLANGEGLGLASSPALEHHALEVLDPLFVSLPDLILNGDGITGPEIRKFLNFDLILN